MATEGLTWRKFCILLGESRPASGDSAISAYLESVAKLASHQPELRFDWDRHPALYEVKARGLLTPFLSLIENRFATLMNDYPESGDVVLACLAAEVFSLEQLVRRAFILELNIAKLKGNLRGENESEQFQDFCRAFENIRVKEYFFNRYPVLLRLFSEKLDALCRNAGELVTRLRQDREDLSSSFNIATSDGVAAVQMGGDSHNQGRKVCTLEFRSGTKLVYKPRSITMESAWQSYLEFFNSLQPELTLKTIRTVDKGSYGWVEYVKHCPPSNEIENKTYHYKLGYLTALVFSLDGVDIFFENLVASQSDPIIIDLETLFHSGIELEPKFTSPKDAIRRFLLNSVTGIGILPQPTVGASDDQVFDVSAMGAQVDAQAPYKVTGVENFGRSDMRITEISGWIPESTSVPMDQGSLVIKESYLSGLEEAFRDLHRSKKQLADDSGVIDRLFGKATRRILVRDTKAYGSLQQDETHPDLIQDQIERQWHWDNLWADFSERPYLSLFIESELRQVKLGDIPYFAGGLHEPAVKGADGSQVDLSPICADAPIHSVKKKIKNLSSPDIAAQITLASENLGLTQFRGRPVPKLHAEMSRKQNLESIKGHLLSRIKLDGKGQGWIYTTENPVPKAKDTDPIRLVSSNPYLYDGVSGVAMFLHASWLTHGCVTSRETSAALIRTVVKDAMESTNANNSGFNGLASLIYSLEWIARLSERADRFDAELAMLSKKLSLEVQSEEQLDFLLGLSGVAAAVLPFFDRSNDSSISRVLQICESRLGSAAAEIVKHGSITDGFQYARGLSHGFSGLALALYRLAQRTKNRKFNDLAAALIHKEYQLVLEGGWTDEHSYAGSALIGWCHGAAGITLALSEMPAITGHDPDIQEYHKLAIKESVKAVEYQSKCLCHGSLGSISCLPDSHSFYPGPDHKLELLRKCEDVLFADGFSSFGSAQTLGSGLMTGLSGAGFFILSQENENLSFDFLSLR